VLGVGDGAKIFWQLQKTYSSGHVRKIEKPILGTVLISKNDVLLTQDDWHCDHSIGIVSLEDPPAGGVTVKAGFQFEVPVRFDTDKLDIVHEAYLLHNVPSIPLIELVEPGVLDGETYYGGGSAIEFSSDITISAKNGRVQYLKPSANGFKVYLPNPNNFEWGGPHFYLIRAERAVTLKLVNFDGIEIYRMDYTGSDSERIVSCYIYNNDGDGIKRWGVLAGAG
jgi:hypothetical protein